MSGIFETLNPFRSGHFGDIFGLFDEPQKVDINPPPTVPELPEDEPMPVSDDEDVKRARRRAIARRQSQGGRTSTILTSGSGTGLGG